MPKKIKVLILTLISLFIFPSLVLAQQNPSQKTYNAKVTKIVSLEQSQDMDGKPVNLQNVELEITNGDLIGQTKLIEGVQSPYNTSAAYKPNDKVIVYFFQNPDGTEYFYIADYDRSDPLFWLAIMFIALTLVIARFRGLMSLVGLALSFLVIFLFVLPRILAGNDPIFIAIIASLFLVPLNFYLSHGINQKTTAAVIGTILGLIITGFLASLFTNTTHLTGFNSEEAGFLRALHGDLNIKGIFLAGIIIGVIGILDDIAVSQSAIVFQLKHANNKLNIQELFTRGMNVGKDHIASIVNTLVLVYTGASLPLLLLFINSPQSLNQIISMEMVSSEIVRTLVGSIGLILTVPITTLIAAFFADPQRHKI